MTDSVARVLVAVVTFNSVDLLEDLVRSLPDGLAGLEWQLVVADNASSDATVSRLRELAPEATPVAMGRNAGYAAGINAAVAASSGHDAVLVLNPDVRLRPGCVRRLARALEEDGVGIAVPRLLGRDGGLVRSMRREPTLLRMAGDTFLGASRSGRWPLLGEIVTDARRYDHEQDTDWAEGSTQLVSSACWAASGPWDETYFLYSEETEFDLRAGDHGFATRYVPDAEAVHLKGDSQQSPGLWALLCLNRVRMFRSRNGLPSTAVFWALLLLRETTRAALGRATSREAARVLCRPSWLRRAPGPDMLAGRSRKPGAP